MFLASLSGCEEPAVRSDGVIVAPGTFSISDIDCELKIWVSDDHIVEFVVRDAAQSVIAETGDRPSEYSSWSFYWDSSTKILWMCSGDIGSRCWQFTIDDSGDVSAEGIDSLTTPPPEAILDAPGYHAPSMIP